MPPNTVIGNVIVLAWDDGQRANLFNNEQCKIGHSIITLYLVF